uniref:Uncharacterized protein n=1 Tax=Panagrolaimus sp. ES5 TaxID=591445 RepID=A0AC34FR25_9BILA
GDNFLSIGLPLYGQFEVNKSSLEFSSLAVLGSFSAFDTGIAAALSVVSSVVVDGRKLEGNGGGSNGATIECFGCVKS